MNGDGDLDHLFICIVLGVPRVDLGDSWGLTEDAAEGIGDDPGADLSLGGHQPSKVVTRPWGSQSYVGSPGVGCNLTEFLNFLELYNILGSMTTVDFLYFYSSVIIV